MLTLLDPRPVVSFDRSLAIESISSIKRTEINFVFFPELFSHSHAALLAQSNHLVIFCSVSPTYFPLKSAPVGAKNNTLTLGSSIWSWLTAAFAIKVFPVPGGPYNKNPFPTFGYKLGYISGLTNDSLISSFSFLSPAKSEKKIANIEELMN